MQLSLPINCAQLSYASMRPSSRAALLPRGPRGLLGPRRRAGYSGGGMQRSRELCDWIQPPQQAVGAARIRWAAAARECCKFARQSCASLVIESRMIYWFASSEMTLALKACLIFKRKWVQYSEEAIRLAVLENL